MKLLSPDMGWVLSYGHLYWTADGGNSWEDITPQDQASSEIATVSFADTSRGWVLLTRRNSADDVSGFDLAVTTSAGTKWSIMPVVMPSSFDPNAVAFSREAYLDFVDPLHGWMNLGAVSSSNFNRGYLLNTTDGGKTWKHSTADPGIAASVRFVNMNDGWMAGGPGNERLYSTYDGGQTWQQQSLKAPPQVEPATLPKYYLPTFTNSLHGFVPVVYSGGYASDSTIAVEALVLFATADGGRTWVPDRTLKLGTSPTPHTVTTVADSAWITASVSDGTLNLTKIASDGTTSTTRGSVLHKSAVTQISFADPNTGWASLASGRILATRNGGATWTDVTPKAAMSSAEIDAGSAMTQAAAEPILLRPGTTSAMNTATLSTFFAPGVGFDMCEVTVASNYVTLMNSSPFVDTGVYIGGSNRSCANSYLDSTWVSNVTGQGWGLLPLWPGPQAPCTTGFKTYIATDGTAYAQGQSEASSAIAAASALGLPNNTIIYYDIENYNPAATKNGQACGSYVNSFLSGWASQLHSNGYFAAVYGNPAPATTWHNGAPAGTNPAYSAVSPLPDDIWIAKIDKRATIWGLTLSDSYWNYYQRSHQYTQNQVATWSGLPSNTKIDNDIIDGDVTGGNGGGGGTKTYNVTYTGFQCDPGSPGIDPYTFPGSINNINSSGLIINGPGQVGTIVGSTNETYSFTYALGACGSTFSVPGADYTNTEGIDYSGSFSGFYQTSTTNYAFYYKAGSTCCSSFSYPKSVFTNGYGMNDDKQIVGYYGYSTGWYLPFIYNALTGTFTSVTVNGSTCNTLPKNVNGDTEMVGIYSNTSNCQAYGFLYDNTSKNTTSIQFCGAENTWAYGVNNNGIIVGSYEATDTTVHGFIAARPYGCNNFSSFDFPGASSTTATAISDSGEITGYYFLSSTGTNEIYGFVSTPW